jgi:TatD DNase family protein
MMNSALVDFHCHVDLFDNMGEIIDETERARVYTLAVTTTPRAWERNRELTKDRLHVRAALGLHPQLVADRAAELSLWHDYLSQTRYVGEVGLDAGPRFYRSLDRQVEVFDAVLMACAEAGDKVISVHSVRSASKVLDMLEHRLPPGRGRVVLHWFTGTKSEARRAVELGCFFSVNAQMLVGARGQEILGVLPRNRVLTETDGPFTEHEGRPARPSDVSRAVALLAARWGVDAATAASSVLATLRDLLAHPASTQKSSEVPL